MVIDEATTYPYIITSDAESWPLLNAVVYPFASTILHLVAFCCLPTLAWLD